MSGAFLLLLLWWCFGRFLGLVGFFWGCFSPHLIFFLSTLGSMWGLCWAVWAPGEIKVAKERTPKASMFACCEEETKARKVPSALPRFLCLPFPR